MAAQRLDKIIASTGRWSRREVKDLVRQGRVTVDGVPARSAEEKADPEQAVIAVNGEKLNWLQDGSLVMGNLMTAAAALGLGSCWINRAMELFDRPEGKALLQKWGLPETYRGVGNCILGYVDGDLPAPKPRKDGWILRV